MKWNAFVMARNEEKHIRVVIESIKNQKPDPPRKIFVLQDGSTDNTKAVIDDIGGLCVEHVDPHEPSLGAEFWAKRNHLMLRAENDADYILCMDGDAHIQESYVHEIIVRMERDGVVAAHGFDKADPQHTLVEPGMVIKSNWLRRYRAKLPASNVIVCASVTGMRTAVYYDVGICYMRKIGTRHNTEWYELKGRHWKMLGHSLVFVLYQSARFRNLHFLRGYLKEDTSRKNEFTEWTKRWERDIALHKVLRKRRMSQRTQFANYIMPEKIKSREYRDDYGVWKGQDTSEQE